MFSSVILYTFSRVRLIYCIFSLGVSGVVFSFNILKNVFERKNAKMAAALATAIGRLYDVQERLMQNAEYFRAELATIKATIEFLKNKKK